MRSFDHGSHDGLLFLGPYIFRIPYIHAAQEPTDGCLNLKERLWSNEGSAETQTSALPMAQSRYQRLSTLTGDACVCVCTHMCIYREREPVGKDISLDPKVSKYPNMQ